MIDAEFSNLSGLQSFDLSEIDCKVTEDYPDAKQFLKVEYMISNIQYILVSIIIIIINQETMTILSRVMSLQCSFKPSCGNIIV